MPETVFPFSIQVYFCILKTPASVPRRDSAKLGDTGHRFFLPL